MGAHEFCPVVPEVALGPVESEIMDDTELKQEVASFWNEASCGTTITSENKFTKEYFEEIEEYRYRLEPEIFSFAQFTRFRGKKMLEVGVGAGSDFIQWVRAGAIAHGVDLTEEAVEHVKHRLSVYGLSAEDVRVGDAENLPHEDEKFDLVYSWGVIHHSPDTEKALAEIVRCTKPGGTIKLMLYNRRSLYAFYHYLKFALLRGRPFRSFSDVIYHHWESLGTKAYTLSEVEAMVAKHPLEIKKIDRTVSSYDLKLDGARIFRPPAYLLACLCGWRRCGWYMAIDLTKK